MATTHITDKGPKRCVAKSEASCRAKYDGEKAPHFTTEADADKAYQAIEATKHKLLASMKKEEAPAPAKKRTPRKKAEAPKAAAKQEEPRAYPQGFSAQELDQARGRWTTITFLQKTQEEAKERLTALQTMKRLSTRFVDPEALKAKSQAWEEENAKLPQTPGVTRVNPYIYRLDEAAAKTFPEGRPLPSSTSFADALQRYEARQEVLDKHMDAATEEALQAGRQRDSLKEKVRETTGYEENPVFGVPSDKTTQETSYRLGSYSSAPTKNVPVLVDAKAGVEGAVKRPCRYCGTSDPEHVKFVQASYSDETRCSRCGGVEGYGVGD